MINHWTTDEDSYLVVFKLTIPKDKYSLDFINKALLINEKHKTQKLTCKEPGNAIDQYIADLSKQKQGNIGFKFTSVNNKTYDFKYNTLDKVCFYDESGKLVEEEVECLGTVLRAIHGAEESKSNMGLISPIHLWNSPNIKANLFTCYIQIHSDIYFPTLLNCYKIGEELYPNQDFVDNRELAVLNTVIFNNWFRELSALFKEHGGHVVLDEKPELLYDFKIDFDASGILHKI